MGYQLGKGRKLNDIIEEMSMVAEGVKSASVVMELSEEYKVIMPIAREVCGVLYEGKSVQDAFRGLIRHKVGKEAEPG